MLTQIQSDNGPTGTRQGELNFLVIDDDPVFLAVAEAIIASLGDHRVALAENGISGLERASQTDDRLDVIILDLNMPQLDGLGFLRSLSETGFGGGIIISSGETDAVVKAARRMGELLGLRVLGALRKPFNAEALRSMIGEAGSRQRGGIPAVGTPPPAAKEQFDLLVYFQPQFDIRSRSIVGFEALTRARLNDGSIKGPDFVFDGVATPDELRTLTRTICRSAFSNLHEWRKKFGYRGTVSVNVDVALIERPDFAEDVVRLASEADVSTDSIVLELTETTLASDFTRLLESLTRLRMAGVLLSVDDFGTGGSNFDLLAFCPFTELKIDRSVIVAAPHDDNAHRFLRFCGEAARDLKLAIVGEGIETDAQLRIAASAGVEVAQGFLFSRPLPPQEIHGLLSSKYR